MTLVFILLILFIIFLAAHVFALDLRVSRLNDRLRNVERALSSMNKKYND